MRTANTKSWRVDDKEDIMMMILSLFLRQSLYYITHHPPLFMRRCKSSHISTRKPPYPPLPT